MCIDRRKLIAELNNNNCNLYIKCLMAAQYQNVSKLWNETSGHEDFLYNLGKNYAENQFFGTVSWRIFYGLFFASTTKWAKQTYLLFLKRRSGRTFLNEMTHRPGGHISTPGLTTIMTGHNSYIPLTKQVGLLKGQDKFEYGLGRSHRSGMTIIQNFIDLIKVVISILLSPILVYI